MLKQKNKFSKRIFGKEFRGIFLTLGFIAFLLTISHGFYWPGFPGLLVLAIVYSAFDQGTRAAILSAVLGIAYCTYVFASPDQMFHYTKENLLSLILWAVTMLGSAGIVNLWRRRTIDTLSKTMVSAPPRVSDTQIIRMDAFSSLMPAYVALDGSWINVPQTLCKFLGYSESELLAKNEKEVTYPDDYDVHWKELQRVIRGEIPSYDYEKRLVRKDKKIVWVNASCSVVNDLGGQPMHFATYIRDITDRKKRELQLHESEERFRALIENSMDAVSLISPEGTILYASPATAKVLGYETYEFVGRNSFELMHTDDLKTVQRKLKELTEQPNKTGSQQFQYRHKNGTWRWVEAVAKNLLDLPSVQAIVINYRDITESKTARDRLTQSEAKFRSLIQNSSDVITILDGAGTILYISPSVEKIIGFTPAQMIGKSAFEFIHQEDIPDVVAAFRQRAEGEGRREPTVYRFKHRDGTWHYLESIGTNLLDDPSINGIVINARDITERKMASEKLVQSELRYKQLVETANDVIYRIDPNGFFTYANPIALRVIGYEGHEFMGKHFLRFMRKDYRTMAIDLYQRQIRDKIPNTYFEFPVITKDASDLWLGQNVQIVLEHGNVVELQSVARDITERKMAEQLLAQSEAKFRSLIQNSTDIITIVDREGIIVYESPSIEKIFGVPGEQLIGMNVFQFVHREDLPEVVKAFERLVNGEGPQKPPVYRYRHKDGSWRYLESTGTNLMDNPSVNGFVINSRDVTERILDEENLRNTSSLLNATLESTADGILVVDNDGKWVSFNQKFIQMWGVPDYLLASRSDDQALEFALSKLKDPEGFTKKVRELYDQPDKTSFDLIEFKDGRTFERFSQPQRIGDMTLGRVWSFRDITERRLAEENLKESRANLMAVMENTEDSIWSIDPAYRILTINSTFRKLFSLAYGATLAPGMIITDHLPADVKTVWTNLYQKALRGEQFTTQQHYEFSGIAIDVDVSFNPIFSAGREITGVSVFSRNITEKKKAEDTLRENEERYIQMFEKNRAVKWFINPETGDIVDANPAAAEFYGYPLEQLRKMKIYDINVSPTEVVSQDLKRAQHLQRDFFLLKHRLASGEIRDVEVHSGPVMIGGQELLFSIIHDITERKRAEEALLQSEEKYRSIFENINEGIYQCTEDGQFLTVNTALVKMLGYESEQQVMKLNLNTDVFEHAHKRSELNRQTRQSGVNLYAEVNWKRKDGSVFLVRLNDRAVYDGQGSFQYYEVTVEDISERKKLEQHLIQAQKTESIGRIAGGIAHDMNNMLAVILPTAEMMKEFANDPELVKKYSEVISSSTRRASDIIKQLLVFARQMPLKTEVIRFNDLVRETQKMLEHFIGKNISIELHLDESLSAIDADMTQMQQVLMNLCVNARDAMRHGGVLSISTRKVTLDAAACKLRENLSPGNYLACRVSDTGTGIPADIVPKIFEAFFSTKETGQGTGLGLAVVKSIVLNHRGSIEVQSELNKGTTFTIHLPIGETSPSQKTADRIEESPKGIERILVVDDETEILNVCVKILSELGYKVLTASGGREALKVYREHAVDLVLIDIQMPGMDGRETLKQLRLINPAVKALYATGYANPEILKSIDQTREAGIIEKPFSINGLAKAIKQTLTS
jgi:PAS domain S-box-containing protein